MIESPCPFCDAKETELKLILMEGLDSVVDTHGVWLQPDWIAHCYHFHVDLRACWCGFEVKNLYGFRAHLDRCGGLHAHAQDHLMGVKDGNG